MSNPYQILQNQKLLPPARLLTPEEEAAEHARRLNQATAAFAGIGSKGVIIPASGKSTPWYPYVPTPPPPFPPATLGGGVLTAENLVEQKTYMFVQDGYLPSEVVYQGIQTLPPSSFKYYMFFGRNGTLYVFAADEIPQYIRYLPSDSQSPGPAAAPNAARSCPGHDYVDVGFMHPKMACRHCGVDSPNGKDQT